MFPIFRKVLLSAFLISSVSLSQNDYSISGRVISSDDEGLPGVEVFISALNLGSVTNGGGEFKIEKVPSGLHSVIFSSLGFTTIIRDVNVPSEEALSILVTLEPEAINLTEVVVTGNPFLSDPKELSQTTISLNKMELIIQSNQTIADALNFQPGIAMRTNGIATGRPVIRGFSNNKVLVLEDGLRMGDLSNSSDDHSISDDGSQPDKLEVLQGPSSLLYGSGAIGGVVNIITDAIPPMVEEGLHGELLTQGSTVNNSYLGNAHLNYGTGIIALHAKVLKRKGEDYRIPGGGTAPGSELDNYFTQGGLSVHPGWGTVGFSYSGFNNKYGLPVNPTEGEEAYIDMKKDQFRIAGGINKINSFLTSVSLKGAYIDYGHKEIARESGEVETEFDLKTLTADISFTHKPVFRNSNGIFGIYALHNKYDVTGEEALTPNSDYSAFALYFLEKIRIALFTFTFGARYEYNQINFPSVMMINSFFGEEYKKYSSLSASLGITYELSKSISLFVNAANAFRAPSVEELSSYGIHRASAGFEIGSRTLNAEKTLGLDAGIRTITRSLQLEFTGFYNRVNNLIYRQPGSQFYDEDEGFNDSETGYRVYRYQQAKADIYGLQGRINYNFIRNFSFGIVSDYVEANNVSLDENISMIPPFRFSSEIRYMSPAYWYGIKWNLTAKQNKTAPGEQATPGYGIIALYAGVKFITGEYAHIIDFKINNILNQPYRDHLSAIKEFTYMPARNISAGYRFLF